MEGLSVKDGVPVCRFPVEVSAQSVTVSVNENVQKIHLVHVVLHREFKMLIVSVDELVKL